MKFTYDTYMHFALRGWLCPVLVGREKVFAAEPIS